MEKQKFPKLPRNQSREAYRLWFEFLQRAIARDKSNVNLKLYSEWGDVTSYKFDKWWREIGSTVINLSDQTSVAIVDMGSADDQSYLIRVPKSLNSTQIGEQVRALLISKAHTPQKTSSLRVSEGAEIRPMTYRAYLHTYDINEKMKVLNGGKDATAKDLLIAVRKFYLERAKKYKNHNWSVDNIPMALMSGLDFSDHEKFDVLANASASAAVKRYLREANIIMDAVEIGKFPK